MDLIISAKKRNSVTGVAHILTKNGMCLISSTENTIHQILRHFLNSKAWAKSGDKVVKKTPILAREKALEHNINHKLPAPYFVDNTRRPLKEVKHRLAVSVTGAYFEHKKTGS